MLKRIRTISLVLFLALITLLFLDFTGTLHSWFGWMAKIQFFPALMALNFGIITGLILITLLLGRIYCSVVCPLGLFQDLISKVASRNKKNRFYFSKAMSWLRYGVLILFVIAFIAGFGSFVALLEPYSAFGRIVSNLLAPLYQLVNNFFASLAERMDSYAFYEKEVWIRSISTFSIAVITLISIVVLAWRGGRTYCNTICPVGTVLGFLSQFSIYKHRIDTSKCNSCGLCAKNCKASCIDAKSHTIDYSRCVSCYNCIGKCKKEAIKYTPSFGQPKEESVKEQPVPEKAMVSNDQIDSSRRNMLTIAGTLLATSAIKAQGKKVDGGLAFIEDKKIPERQTQLVPAGAQNLRNFTRRCTGCQLCVSACPNNVLRPSTALTSFMQPEMSYERGYCRPECTKCSEVCPAGAITAVSREDKSSTQIGHAVWIEKNCVVLTDGVSCGNCARHCPVGAIVMIEMDEDGFDSKKIPTINTERCIGCGACENLCPARPFSAIYVEGHTMHRTI